MGSESEENRNRKTRDLVARERAGDDRAGRGGLSGDETAGAITPRINRGKYDTAVNSTVVNRQRKYEEVGMG